ncbi:glycosyltransferase [Roseomonas sp. CCTCC AB2023176]|uniref:glycosyltransferase n=1 Tax=Roseomonas sp. CCTCC AB2023176 TaxID=3342640 RepID=UPI0035D65BE7
MPVTLHDLIGAVTATVADGRPDPALVTISRRPAAGLLPQIFGEGLNIVVSEPPGPPRPLRAFRQTRAGAPPEEVAPVDGASGLTQGDDPSATVLRFVEPGTLARVAASHPGLLRNCAAVLLQFAASQSLDAVLTALAEHGLRLTGHYDLGRGAPVVLARRPAAYAVLERSAGWPARLAIVDPCLDGARGHYLPLARSLTAGGQDLGLDVTWACHARLDPATAPPGVAVHPVFARSFFDLPPEALGQVDLGPEIAAALRGFLNKVGGAATHLLAHSADPALLRAALALAEDEAPIGAPFHLVIPNQPWIMPGRAAGIEVSRALARLAATASYGREVFLWAETRELGRQVSERLGRTVPALQLPAPAWAAEGVSPPPDLPLRLVFLGEARPEKGFADLPALAATLGGDDGLRSIILDVQVLPPHRGPTSAYEEALARLGANPQVRLHRGPLDDGAYRERLRAAHAVLLPYDPDRYAGRGSGIMVDAIAAGRVVVARDGPTVAELATDGVALRYSDPSGFARAVRTLLHDHTTLLSEAARRAVAFRCWRDPAATIRSLEHRVAFVGS